MHPSLALDGPLDAALDRAPGYVVSGVLCAPVAGAQGRVLGAVMLCNRLNAEKSSANCMPAEFSAVDERSLSLFTSMLGPVLERALREDYF